MKYDHPEYDRTAYDDVRADASDSILDRLVALLRAIWG